MNKKIIIGIIIIVIVVISAAVFYKPAPKEAIKIGAIIPLSGEYARWGEFGKYGIELALEELKKDPFFQQYSIEVIYENSQGITSVAVSAFNKLVTIDKIKIVITSLAQIGLPIQALANQNKIVQIDHLIVAPSYSTPSDYSFRTANSLKVAIEQMAELGFNRLRAKKTAVIYVNNDFGAQGYKVFKEKYQALGGTLVVEEAQKQGGTDFRTEIIKIKQANPDVIALISDPLESVAFIKQVKELDVTSRLVATEWSITDDFLKIAGDAAENLIFYTSFDDESLSQNEPYTSFRARHLERYDKIPEITSVQAYDAIILAGQATKKCRAENFSTECIKTKLAETQNYEGASGRISFDVNGDVSKPIYWKIIKNGQFVPYTE